MSSTDATTIFDRLSSCFAVEENVLRVIVDQLVDQTVNMKLNKLTIQPIFKQIRKSCPKSNLPEMNILFKCCYVLILSLREHYLLLDNVEDLCGDYPEFIGLPAEELNKLLKFRNAMKISLQLIDAKHHKGELLEICGRLSGKLVTTGGSQTTETKRRVMVYEREGGMEAEGKGGKKRKLESEVRVKDESEQKKVKSEVTEEATGVRVKSEYSSQLPYQVVNFLGQQLRSKFSASDADNYQNIVEKTLVQTTHNKELNKLTLRPVMKELRKLFPRKEIWTEMNVLYKCCYVLILSHRDRDGLLWLQHEQLLEAYPFPEFADLTSSEIEKLLIFRNAMRLSLQLIDAKHHKGELLEVCGRLSGRVVTTGGGQTVDTTRCVMIYEQEGGISGTAKKVKDESSANDAFPGLSQQSLLLPTSQGQQEQNLSLFDYPWSAAGLERADTGFSLFDKTFSFQSTGSMERLGSLGSLDIGDFSLDLPALSAEFPSPAELSHSAAALRATPSPRPTASIHTTCSNSASKKAVATQAAHARTSAEVETDIDTELDSVEVATEVDESENHSGDDEEAAALPDRMEIADGVSEQECADLLCDMFRTRSLPLRGNTLTSTATADSTASSTTTVVQPFTRTDTFGRLDVGIARLGSLRSLNIESFTWTQ
jgi:hypothetical protein